MRRNLIPVAVFVFVLSGLVCRPASSQPLRPTTPPAHTSAGAGKLQFIDVNDPVYGVEEGKLAMFAGWRGSASVTRNDAACPDCNAITMKMTSPDGRSSVETYDTGLHTSPNQYPGQKGRFLRTRFTSTGDLIVRGILPGLALGGQVSAPRPALDRQVKVAMADIQRHGLVTSPMTQGAAVTVTGTNSGNDYVIEALSGGGFMGTPAETTVTRFTVITAPAGQAEALAKQWEAFPVMTVNPAWRQADDDHLMVTLRRMQAQQQQQSAQTQQFMHDYNAKQAAFNASSNASNAAARNSQQARANQSLQDSQQNQRNITDSGQQTIDSRNGTSRYYTFCNSRTGQVAYQYNTTVPPDTSGQWLRCGN